MRLKYLIIFLTFLHPSYSYAIYGQKQVLIEKTFDLNNDKKQEKVTLYRIQFTQFITVDNSKPFALSMLGSDAKLLDIETIDISPKQRLLKLHHSAGSAGTSDITKREYLFLFSWDGKNPKEVGKINTLNSYFDYEKNKQQNIIATPTFKDLNGDGYLDIDILYSDGKKEELYWDKSKSLYALKPTIK